MARKNKGSQKTDPKPISPVLDDENSHSPTAEEVDEEEIVEEEEMEDIEHEEVEDEEIGDDNVDGEEKAWPKNDDFELFRNIRKACPKNDFMKYDTRSKLLDWESIKFQDYSAEQCKNRWKYVQDHLRHYRIITEVLDDAMTWVETPWFNFNRGGKHKQRHPDQPKRPLTSYMLYYMEKKDAVMEKQPGLGVTELSKVIAKMYNELSDEKKAIYVKLAEKEKEAFTEKMKKFVEDNPDYVIPNSQGIAKPVPPKLATPFKLFSDEKMPTYVAEGLTLIEARDRCRGDFKELTDKEKLKWIHKALDQEKEYDEKMIIFKAKYPEVELPAKKSLLTKDEMQMKNKSQGKPDKPPNSGYGVFARKLLTGNALKEFQSRERMLEASRRWKELSEEERNKYNQKAIKLTDTYKMKYAAYLENLTPEEKTAELTRSKNLKRVAGKKTEEHPVVKKKRGTAVNDDSSSEMEEDGDVTSDEDDFKIPSKPAIQKLNSPLQMFCKVNMEKYSSKHPKLTKQELTKLMAKEFSKLSKEKKNTYGDMIQKSKNGSSASTSAKGKSLKSAETSKKAATSSATASKSPPGKSNGSSPKKSAEETNSKPVKSSSEVKTSLNVKPKSGNAKASSKATDPPIWAAGQSLFKSKNGIEPPKPPKSAAAYYVMKHHSKTDLSSEAIDRLWGNLSEKQKNKWIAEHEKKMSEYPGVFENYVRALPQAELKQFRAFIKAREQALEEDEDDGSGDEDVESSSEGEASDEPSDEESADEDEMD